MSIGKEFALLFGVLFLPGMIAQSGAVDPRAFESIVYHLQLLATAVPQILLVVVVSNMRRPGSARRFGWKRLSSADAPAALVGVAGIWVVVGVVSLVAGTLLAGADAAQARVEWSFQRLELVPLLVVSTLAIGYREEIFYRAYLTDRAEEAEVNPRLALAMGALIFAAGHLYQGIMGFAIALAIGLFLGELYYRTRSLHGIAIAHGLYNLLVLLASGSA